MSGHESCSTRGGVTQQAGAARARSSDSRHVLPWMTRENRSGVIRRREGDAVVEAGLARCRVTGSDEQRSAYLATPGGGPVTWSYFGMLLGQQDSKPDTWLQRYALQALGVTPSPESTRMLVNAAASEVGVEPSRLDHAIWRYASGRRWHTARKREVCRQARILDEPTRGVDDNLCLSRRLASERLPTTPARSCGAHLAKTLEVVDRTAVVLLPALNNRAYTRSSSCPARGTSVPGANRENRVEESRLDLLGHPPGHGGSSIPMVACMCAMNEASLASPSVTRPSCPMERIDTSVSHSPECQDVAQSPECGERYVATLAAVAGVHRCSPVTLCRLPSVRSLTAGGRRPLGGLVLQPHIFSW